MDRGRKMFGDILTLVSAVVRLLPAAMDPAMDWSPLNAACPR
ncbi:MAG TPA: hypothetical protein VI893_02355 [Thermoplasmata archaeon]|nr:hypothetical protein [Thermoplasmata archaeon]